jgi:Cdc6-like AAA superfamily ATPase
MPEDSGKKDFISDFLNSVKTGLGLIEDIWIDREVKKKDSSGGVYNQAESLSGNSIETITELLEDDLRYCFEETKFVFRIIAAEPGSGKTTILDYLLEKINANQNTTNNRNKAIKISINDVLEIPSKEKFNFNVIFYLYLISHTLKEILKESNELKFRNVAKEYLKNILPKEHYDKIKSQADNSEDEEQLVQNIWEALQTFQKPVSQIFLKIVDHFSKNNCGLFFLIDELDSLHGLPREAKETVNLLRNLINAIYGYHSYKGKLAAGIYISGISDDVQNLIDKEDALKSRVNPGRVRLVAGTKSECDQIQEKIKNRLMQAYQGCQKFENFRSEIEKISLKRNEDYKDLRGFCQKYAGAVLEIHQKYFQYFDKGFNQFEKKAREELEKLCCKKWQSRLGSSPRVKPSSIDYHNHDNWKRLSGKSGYELRVAQTTTKIETHNFDCYAELLHNDCVVAKAFGEAKNYELLTKNFTVFKNWLNDVQFDNQKEIPDLAYLFAPACPELLKMKIKNSEIELILLDKEENLTPTPEPATPTNLPESPFSQADLARRFKVAAPTIGYHKKKKRNDFALWSQNRDPQGISWSFCQETQKFYPQNRP